MLKRVIGIAITVFLLAALTGCGGGGDRVSVQPQAGQPRIAANLVDMDGNSVSGAAVDEIGGGRIGTTGAQGQFTVPLASVPAAGATVRLAARKPGYRDGFYTLRVDRSSFADGVYSVTLRIEAEASSADSATRAGVALANGETLDIEPVAVTEGGVTFYKTTVTLTDDVNAVVFTTPAQSGDDPDVAFTIGSADGAGTNASGVLGKTGAVTGSVSYGDPTDPVALETFPGEFITRSDTGTGETEQTLITAGFARISLTDANGQPITEFAPGQSATIKMMVPAEVENPETGTLVRAGDTIPVFIFNEDTGEWIVERNSDGSVKRSTVQQDNSGNLFVEFTTTHLSTFNLDWFGQVCSGWGADTADTPVITLLDSSGAPVNGATVYFNSASGWTKYPVKLPDNTVTLLLAPRGIEWQVWAKKDGLTSDVATVRACKDTRTGSSKFTLVFHTEPPEPKCSSNSDCDDGNPLTYDKCAMPGQPTAVCVNYGCYAVCGTDAACGDGNALTTDACVNPGTCLSYCSHNVCAPVCTADAQCDDGNALTTDACGNPGTCAAACAHTSCAAACSTHAGCADTNPDTTEKCLNGGTCSASCAIYEAACDLRLDKVNYVTGETMLITFTGGNAGPDPVLCGAAAALKRGQSPAIWNSFGENLYATLPPFSTSVSQTISKVIPGSWAPTSSPQGADYDIYTVHLDGAFWTKGDNFNIHVEEPCAVACSTNADCDDGNALTTDSCVSPGACAAACTHNTCPVACAANADCDDSNPLTADTCGNPGTCAAACANTPCTPACLTDANCNDGNALTYDTCSSPNTCAAACVFSPCTPACINDANCNDGNALTNDTCSNPNACAAVCVNVPCTPACINNANCDDSNALTNDSCNNPNTCAAACTHVQCPVLCANDQACDDGNPMTIDTCNNPGACDASCYNTSFTPVCGTSADCNDYNPVTSDICVNPFTISAYCLSIGASASPTNVYLRNGQAKSTLTCTATGTVTLLEGRCDTSGDWQPITTGITMVCTYTEKRVYTPGCRLNGSYPDDVDTPVTVPNMAPVPTLMADPLSGNRNLNVNFTGTCRDIDGSCVSYLWDFGDGSPTSSLQNPSHTFQAVGMYNVTLTATDDDGATRQTQKMIRVHYGKIYGKMFSEANSVRQTADGGYILAGFTTLPSGNVNGNRELWVLKLDPDGNKVWDKTFGGALSDVASSIRQTADGGYIVAGRIVLPNGADGNSDMWLLKLDSNGNKEWDRTFGGDSADGASSVLQTSDGGYILLGTIWYVGNNYNNDIKVLKLDSNGGVVWEKIYGGTSYDQPFSVKQTSDGGYIIAGGTYNSKHNILLLKIDANGNQEWIKTGSSSPDVIAAATSVQQTADGGYAVAGCVGCLTEKAWLMKLDANSNELWTKAIHAAGIYSYIYSMELTTDGGFITAGSTYTGYDVTNYDMWIVKLTETGDMAWSRTFGETKDDQAYSIQQTSDGGYIVAGYIYPANDSTHYLWVLKLDAAGDPIW